MGIHFQTQTENQARPKGRAVLFIIKNILPHICGNCARVCSGFYGDELGTTLCVRCATTIGESWSFEQHVVVEFRARMDMMTVDRKEHSHAF